MSMNIDSPRKVLVALAGAAGAIGSTVAAGLSLARKRELSGTGLATEGPAFRDFMHNLPGLEEWQIVGWDIFDENLHQAALKHRCCGNDVLSIVCDELSGIIPRPPLFPGESAGNSVIREADWLRSEAIRIGATSVVIVNICPTEPLDEQIDDKDVDWSDLQSLNASIPGITASRLYFRLAIELEAIHINFTPNTAETPALRQLADARGALYCGRDGKTGQTFLKTVIAPALRDRNLAVDGWFSVNLLGNEDGRALQADARGATKKKSKRDCLSSILGYTPGGLEEEGACHQVHIHYYPPRGDSKEAWDNIDFRGFFDEGMQLKLNWLGKDSVLAAPFLIDLIRILLLARRAGEHGLVEAAAYFFKQPITIRDQPPIHDTASQAEALRCYLRRLSVYSDTGLAHVLRHLVERQRGQRHSLSLHASECRMTAGSALALASDLASRYCLPDPGDDEPGDIIFGNARPLEGILGATAESFGRALGADFVDLAPLSGFHAADLLFTAFCRPGDAVFLVDFDHGGHPEMASLAEHLGAEVNYIPYLGMKPDWQRLGEMAEARRPRLVYVNASDYVSAAALSEFVRPRASDAIFAFDASQTLGLMLGGALPTPFQAGYDCAVGSTHKSFPGPHKGFFATNARLLHDTFTATVKNKVSSIHTHHLLSLGVALAEFETYGAAYAARTIGLGNALAEALTLRGYSPVRNGEKYTETHQIWLPAPDKAAAMAWFRRLEQTNIFVNYRQLPFGWGCGLRVGLQEAAMLGFTDELARALGDLMADRMDERLSADTGRAALRRILDTAIPIYETPPATIDAVLEALPWPYAR